MNREQAKDYIRGQLAEYLNIITTKKGKQYVCPICDSGNKANGTPALSVTGEIFKCFSCNNGGDIFSLIALQHNLDAKRDFAAILDIACSVLNVGITDNTTTTQHTQYTHKTQAPQPTPKAQATVNYKDFLIECKANACKTDYFKSRGLSEETISRCNLGYITAETLSKYKEACHLDSFRAGEVTIPYGKDYEYFIVRATNTEADGKSPYKWKKPKTEHAGTEPVYNKAVLRSGTEPLFVVEAPLCAMSIMQAGGQAVAIGGTGADKLIAEIDRTGAAARHFILALDNDKAGIKATESLQEQLKAKGISYTTFTYKDGIKDINAYLMADREELERKVQEAIQEATAKTEQAEQEQRELLRAEHNRMCANNLLKDFRENIKKVNTPPTPTGYAKLDAELDGGLYEGLYIIGAISSLGKTTFTLQMADQIAHSGKDVLVFSLEMSAYELIAKSVSRETFKINSGKARTVRDITDTSRYKYFQDTGRAVIEGAFSNYEDYSEHIYIQEGVGDIGIVQIKETVQRHIEATGNTPIVIVDYLQILAPYNERLSDKQNTDKAVLELKRMSRDYKTPVIAISSFNRESYNSPVSLSSNKESGAIEYGSDVVIGLQATGLKEGEDNTTKKENKKRIEDFKGADIRDAEAVILKNRNGKVYGRIQFNFHSRYNYFEEKTITKEDTAEDYNPFN